MMCHGSRDIGLWTVRSGNEPHMGPEWTPPIEPPMDIARPATAPQSAIKRLAVRRADARS